MTSQAVIENLVHVLEEINVSSFLDDFGPKHIIQIYCPEKNIQGLLIIDNTFLGPACGLINLCQGMTPRELFKYARAMTFSAAVNQVNLGGGAAWIKMGPGPTDKLETIRAFAKEIAPYIPNQYIASPGMNLGQNEMRAFVESLGDHQGATGKPIDMDGTPYELGVLGLGMGVCIEAVLETAQSSKVMPKSMAEATVAVQGFNTIGATIARYLAKKGAKIVALSDDKSTVFCEKGLEMNKLGDNSADHSGAPSLRSLKNVKRSSPESIIDVDCNILVLPTTKEIITEKNVDKVKATCIVEGLYKPISGIADQALCEKGAIVIPDILTISGAPISSNAECSRIRYDQTISIIERKVRETANALTQHALELGIPLRREALEVAKERLLKALEESS